jgi:UDP-N-acetylmuramoyl-L-alanyl-D-glutamate--2,6-diaminopimelate ligase
MQLEAILKNIKIESIHGSLNRNIEEICIDSRMVSANSMFVAIKGTLSDGHSYINSVVSKGVQVVLCEKLPEHLRNEVTYIVVKHTDEVLGYIAADFYHQPSAQMKVIGVTGTNGKTTVATLLFQLFTKLGYKCGLISTVQNIIIQTVEIATHTTPDAVSIQHLMHRMLGQGCEYIFMEVSSHAIHQHRINGIEFAGGIFTNITHDHLDYHKTFDEYIKVKKSFFDHLPKSAFAITNVDDKRGMVMLQNCNAIKKTYSLRSLADFKGKVLENNLSGLIMDMNGYETYFRMIGTFNAYNLLAVYGGAIMLEMDVVETLSVLSTLNGALGRFETVISPIERVLGIVDYAHTPDAVLNVLNTILQLRQNGERIITVIGCGGDRDRAKRPVMAQVAAEKSDQVIFTSDNPRTEDPELILDEMEAELSFANKRKCLRITDRRAAIKTACSIAQPNDIVVLVGKGHETYQEINGVKNHFDDKEELITCFKLFNK